MIIIMIIISALDTEFVKKMIVPFFLIAFLLLVLVPIFGTEVKGAKRG